MLSGRARSLVLLGWAFAKVLVGYLGGRRPGLAAFHEYYGPDRLVPLTPAERLDFQRFSDCIGCGRCDLGEGERIIASDGAYPGLMQLVRASTRSMPDCDAAVLGFAPLSLEVLQSKVEACPVGVPFVELAAFVRSQAAQLEPGPALLPVAPPRDSP